MCVWITVTAVFQNSHTRRELRMWKSKHTSWEKREGDGGQGGACRAWGGGGVGVGRRRGTFHFSHQLR